MTDFTGTPNDDRLNGGDDHDSFDISLGGADTVKGLGGDDEIHAGGAFGADDRIDGGDGYDTLILDGDYAAGVAFTATTLSRVEHVELGGEHSYWLTLSDRAVASADGHDLSIAGGEGLGSDQHVLVDASAVQAGHIVEFSMDGNTAAASTLIGGAGDDTATFQGSGAFDVSGGGGDDTVALYRAITQADHFAGGEGGNDTMVMLAGQDAMLTGAMIQSVETLWLFGGDYTIDMRDTAVEAGHGLHLYAGDLESGQHVDFDGSRERDGAFTLTGGADADTLAGGRGADNIDGGSGDDILRGGQGGDILAGGDGADSFVYGALADSGHHKQFDLITDLDDANDTIDLSAIDARTDKAGDQAFHQVAAFGGHAGELVLSYDADTDVTTLSVDVDGDATADMRVQIVGDHEGFSHFVL